MPIEFGSGQLVDIMPPALPTVNATIPDTAQPVVPLIGPQGPPGNTGYRHDQTVPATVWLIAHNLGRYPAAVSVHSADLSVNYESIVVQHLDASTLRVSMEISLAGVALII